MFALSRLCVKWAWRIATGDRVIAEVLPHHNLPFFVLFVPSW